MPTLPNAKRELFCQGLAKGLAPETAYAKAGYAAHRQNAHRTMTADDIKARVAELLSRSEERAIVTRQRVLEEMAKIAFAPFDHAQVKAADKRAALMDMAKLEGWVIERSEVGKPGDFSRMTDDELDRYIAQQQGATGLGNTGAALSAAARNPRASRRPH